MIEIVPLAQVEAASVEELLDAAFGSDRHGRTAYKLRLGVAAVPELSFAAIESDRLVGSLQSWPIALQEPDGRHTPLILVGPVAVSPVVQRSGIGKKLMQALIATAEREKHDALMMIGDPDYYERFFGFSAVATQQWDLPGPFERHRLLARVNRVGGLPAIGRVIPDPAFASQSVSA